MFSSEKIDPVTLEVVRNKLDSIANEMEWTLLTSSFSPVVKEGMDASASLFAPDATTLAQASAIPAHLTMLIPCVQNILRTYPIHTMLDGDFYCMNDPYAGGTHIPDITVVAPIFFEGRIIAFAAAMTHHQDMGGMAPGSVPTNATDLYQEGLLIPALRLMRANAYDETLISMLKLNTRIPETLMGDLEAQLAACRVGINRIRDLAASVGADYLQTIFETLFDRSEELTRQSLRTLPQGVFESEDFLDNDGVDLERRIRIKLAVTLSDGNMHVDFTGTSPQVRGPFNCVPSGSLAAANYAVRALTDSSIPTNGGCFRPVTLFLPEGSLVNPVRPAPVNARGITIKMIANNILHALSKAAPERVTAFNANQHFIIFGGKRSDGSTFVVGEGVPGGTGGHIYGDGIDVLESDATNGMNMPAEAMELDFPLRMLRSELRPDSGGPGSFRGGLGLIREYLAMEDQIILTHRGEHHYGVPRGIEGGQPGERAQSFIHRANGTSEKIPGKQMAVLNKGDRLVIETAGGGGYGDPAEREASRVQQDLGAGKISSTESYSR